MKWPELATKEELLEALYDNQGRADALGALFMDLLRRTTFRDETFLATLPHMEARMLGQLEENIPDHRELEHARKWLARIFDTMEDSLRHGSAMRFPRDD